MKPRRGEIWLVNFTPKVGAEMGAPHPALVLSRDDVGVLPLRLVVPITTFQAHFEGVPWMVELQSDRANGLRHKSVADCFQPHSFDVARFITRWGALDDATTDAVARTVAAVMGLTI